MIEIAPLSSPAEAKAFCLAGNATFTLRSLVTGTRFTYQMKLQKSGAWQVSVRTGISTKSILGLVLAPSHPSRPLTFSYNLASKIRSNAPSCIAFSWFWKRLQERELLHPDLEIWHEGHCGACGRQLTVPESIKSGIGPECARQREAAEADRWLDELLAGGN